MDGRGEGRGQRKSRVYSESSGPTLRFGVNRGLGRTRVRLSYGESLRFASIAERYVEGTLTDGINIRGNLDLQNESGNNWEVGWSTKSNPATSLGCWMRRRLCSITTT